MTGSQDHCTKVIDYMKGCQKDLDDRTKGIADSEKPGVYTGAVSFRGAFPQKLCFLLRVKRVVAVPAVRISPPFLGQLCDWIGDIIQILCRLIVLQFCGKGLPALFADSFLCLPSRESKRDASLLLSVLLSKHFAGAGLCARGLPR